MAGSSVVKTCRIFGRTAKITHRVAAEVRPRTKFQPILSPVPQLRGGNAPGSTPIRLSSVPADANTPVERARVEKCPSAPTSKVIRRSLRNTGQHEDK